MFKQGTSGNPAGRPVGSKNKNTQIREVLKEIVADNLAGVKDDLLSLDPKERLDMIIKLMPFVVPKLTSISVDESNEASNAMQHLLLTSQWDTKKAE